MRQLIHNAQITTLDPALPKATALAIDGERILAVGTDALLREADTGWERIDAGGRTILPGLTDAHLHLETFALGLQKVNCETLTRAECLDRVANRAKQTPPRQWVLGHGWNQNNWLEGYGTTIDLDANAPDQPVYLTAKSLHAAWANTAALRLAGITVLTPDPVGGRLGRNPDGSPNGLLFESAMQLVAKIITEPSIEQVTQAIRHAQEILWQMGLTGVHDFDRRRCFSVLQLLHKQAELHLRVTKSIPLEDLPAAAQLGLRSGFGDTTLRIGSVKAFADGALGPHTAAMFQPYLDDPQNQGLLLLDAEQLYDHGRLAVDNGLSMAVHAIGDRAVHEVLDAYAHLREYEAASYPGEKSRLRHRLEHVQVIHPEDKTRLAELGIVASMQPIHATSDMEMADRCWGVRSALAYAWRTQLEHGSILVFGSDAPVESPNPFLGLHAAITRQRADGSPGPEGWHPEQRLSILEAMHGFTTAPAFVTGLEDQLGQLKPGYLADLILLDTNIWNCDPSQIKDIRPVATMIGGAWVWKA